MMDRYTFKPLNKLENEAAVFTVKVALALQKYGIPAHRLEEAVERLSARLKLEGQILSSPTAVLASFGPEVAMQRTFILKAPAGDMNLEKLDRLTILVDDVARGKLSVREGMYFLERILAQPDRFGRAITIFCFCISSASVGRLFGGGWREMVVAALIGLTLGLLLVFGGRTRLPGNFLAAVASIAAMALAKTAAVFLGPFSVYTATVAGLIVLIPGLSLTTAMIELARGHSVSGTARLANGLVVFLMMGFGLALGGRVEDLFQGTPIFGEVHPLPPWSEWAALTIIPATFMVLFKARPRDCYWLYISSACSFLCARYSGIYLGLELGSFISAFVIGLLSALFSRFFNRPSSIFLVPGIMLIVPGSIGFRGLFAMLERDTLSGVESSFSMVLVAAAIVAGLILSTAVVRPRAVV